GHLGPRARPLGGRSSRAGCALTKAWVQGLVTGARRVTICCVQCKRPAGGSFPTTVAEVRIFPCAGRMLCPTLVTFNVLNARLQTLRVLALRAGGICRLPKDAIERLGTLAAELS